MSEKMCPYWGYQSRNWLVLVAPRTGRENKRVERRMVKDRRGRLWAGMVCDRVLLGCTESGKIGLMALRGDN